MSLSWFSIIRLGLVQMCLGSIIVLMTSTLNRLMVVELSLPAVLPGFLVALHYGVQLSRPNWGYLADIGGHRTKWIFIGMAMLMLGALGATASIALFELTFVGALSASVLAYILIGFGVGASGTSLLAMLASYTADHRRAAAAMMTWIMMIFGIAVTAVVVGQLLDPYSHWRLLAVVAGVCAVLMTLTCVALWRIERNLMPQRPPEPSQSIWIGVQEVWGEPAARAFTIFVLLSMIAYFMQELILEPFAGLVFGFSPGQTTSLSGVQNGGVFLGMICVGLLVSGFGIGRLAHWVVIGCVGSAVSLVAIAGAGVGLHPVPLIHCVAALGVFNGIFAVAAIGSMMSLAGQGRDGRTGTRMGLWGAAQAIAAAVGGLSGAAMVDVLRAFELSSAQAFGSVFLIEAVLFLYAASLTKHSIFAATAPARSMTGDEYV